uniref:PH domain-containing protein n=1 Tax=Globisporangium ultimum (strain ATCC 200006 / CBS 805.95 / DAOM BR144) TaxID=431595 RepID=K3XB29_GLOUD
MFKLGINGTVITLRAVSHHAAMYWIEGLQQLKAGKSLEIIGDRPTLESEDDIFRQIDQLTYLREWAPPPPNTPFCWLCVPLATESMPTPANPSCQEREGAIVSCCVS